MAWTVVLGSSQNGSAGNEIWQYEDSATAAHTYSEANGSYSGGIRTFTTPGLSPNETTYVRCRKTGETVERGELSRNYFEARRP
tara:strand:+ start:371 stop:622 length:252 start_codon:yes stop_codon:yes gene_type:complete